jgi:hypothetical protein
VEEQRISFERWLAEVLPDEPPSGVVAYNFNMAECGDWIVEVIGASSYDVNDQEWTCRPSEYIIPREVATEWRLALAYVVQRVSTFVRQSPLKCAGVLRQSQAVCVGFVDGYLTQVWPHEGV